MLISKMQNEKKDPFATDSMNNYPRESRNLSDDAEKNKGNFYYTFNNNVTTFTSIRRNVDSLTIMT